MYAQSSATSLLPSSSSSPSISASLLGNYARPITSCLPCRRRKVKCDRRQPICFTCERGNHSCSYMSSSQSPGLAALTPESSRVTKSTATKLSSTVSRINPRLQRLANILAQAQALPCEASEQSPASRESYPTARSSPVPKDAATPQRRSQEDVLILENGVPRFISGKHWAWMAEEIQDIQFLLSESQKLSPNDENEPQGDRLICDSDSSPSDTYSFYPDTREDCYLLLNVFLANVDPIVRIVHRPSLARRFDGFIRTHYLIDKTPVGSSYSNNMAFNPNRSDAFEPLAMSIFYAAINSMKETDISTAFNTHKSHLLRRYRAGTELYLKQHEFMTSRIFEILQAFVIFLTAQYREDDIGKVWPLTGLAIRMATIQGLHRDPLALPRGTIDTVQVELRRRLWAQICHLDFRAAEGHGFAPSIHESDFDTRLPLNVDDVDLVEGVVPSTRLSDAPKFTDMTIYLLRITAAQCYGRIIQITHASRKRIRACSQGSLGEAQVLSELQTLLKSAEAMAAELEKALDDLVQYCDKRVSLQSMALHLSAHLKSKFWVIFWIQIPRQDREKIISPAIRRSIFMDAATIVENWCTIASSKDYEPFQWHISSHAGFYPILYVLSEVCSPAFQTPEWADLRQRGLQVANAIYEIRGQHTTGAWPAIIWLINRVRFQEGNRTAGLAPGPGPQDNPMLTRSELDNMGSSGLELDTRDFLGFMSIGEFDFPDLAGVDPMLFSNPSQWS
ncbi:quinidine resistance protein 3 [Aspergillus udagawae]|nr:quinidine resistance protein 3 [Aspergillus udagawae]